MKESRFGTDDKLLFRETFEGAYWTDKLGGTITDVGYNNGIASFNGSSSYVLYSKVINTTCTVRIRMGSYDFSSNNNDTIVDFRNNDNSGVGVIYQAIGGALTTSSGTAYINGEASITLSSETKEVVISGISINCFEIFFGVNFVPAGFLSADVDLLEIYEGTWTAEQVTNAYNNRTYRELSSENEVLNIDSRCGVIKDKWDNAITNNNVEIVKAGIVYAMKFDGSTSFLNINSVLPQLASTTTGTWMCWVKPFNASSGTIQGLISFGDTNANEIITMTIDTNGEFICQCNKAGTSQWTIDTDNVVFTSGKPTFAALVHNSTEPILYIDGVAVAQTFTTSTDKTAWFSVLTGIDNGRIGCLNFGSAGNINKFKGQLSQPKIYTGALSAKEIMQTYTNEKNYYR